MPIKYEFGSLSLRFSMSVADVFLKKQFSLAYAMQTAVRCIAREEVLLFYFKLD